MGSTTLGVSKQSDTLPRKAPCAYQIYHLLYLVPTDTATVMLDQECETFCQKINPLPVQFKALLHGQKGCVFFSGHLNLRTAPETGLPSREKKS